MERKSLSNILAILGVTIVIILSFAATFSYGKTLIISVSQIRPQGGVVNVVIYDDEIAFQQNSSTRLAAYASKNISGDTVKFTFKKLLPGKYAIVLHHDENANNEFEMLGGIPSEGWGYSNNVGSDAIPSFQAASFEIKNDTVLHEIQMQYAK